MNQLIFLDRDTLAPHISLPTVVTQNGETHDIISFNQTQPEQRIERLSNARVAIVNKVLIDAEVLAACPTLKHVAVCATGYNNIDLDACRQHGVTVSNIPEYASQSVAEHVLMCALSLKKHLIDYRQCAQANEWPRSETFCVFKQPIKTLDGATLGVIGYGHIGRATADLARAFGMRVIYHTAHKKDDSPDEPVSLEMLLQQSDVVSIHCALNEATHHLIGANELATMKPDAVLINTARGGIVDELAVVQAIQQQALGGIAFDVLTQEPPTIDHPLFGIAHQANVILTPHIAWASDAAMQALANQLIANICAVLDGNPINLVA